MFINLYFKWNR